MIGDREAVVLHGCEDAQVCDGLGEASKDLLRLLALLLQCLQGLGGIIVLLGRQGGCNRVFSHPAIIPLALLVDTRGEAQVFVSEFYEAVVEPAEYLLVEAFVASVGRWIAVPAQFLGNKPGFCLKVFYGRLTTGAVGDAAKVRNDGRDQPGEEGAGRT